MTAVVLPTMPKGTCRETSIQTYVVCYPKSDQKLAPDCILQNSLLNDSPSFGPRSGHKIGPETESIESSPPQAPPPTQRGPRAMAASLSAFFFRRCRCHFPPTARSHSRTTTSSSRAADRRSPTQGLIADDQGEVRSGGKMGSIFEELEVLIWYFQYIWIWSFTALVAILTTRWQKIV